MLTAAYVGTALRVLYVYPFYCSQKSVKMDPSRKGGPYRSNHGQSALPRQLHHRSFATHETLGSATVLILSIRSACADKVDLAMFALRRSQLAHPTQADPSTEAAGQRSKSQVLQARIYGAETSGTPDEAQKEAAAAMVRIPHRTT